MIINYTVGRQREFQKLCLNIRRRIPTLVVGPNEIGKTHLLWRAMHWVREESRLGSKIVFIESLERDKKGVFRDLYLALHPQGVYGPFRPNTSTTLYQYEQYILDAIHQYYPDGNVIIFIDEMGGVDKTCAPILDEILDFALIVGASKTRKARWQAGGHHTKYDVIRLRPLKDKECWDMAGWVWNGYRARGIVSAPTNTETDRHLFSYVIKRTNGVPGAILGTLKNARFFHVLDRDTIRDISVHEGGVEYMTALPLIIAIFAFCVVLRFFFRSIFMFDVSNVMAMMAGIFMVLRVFLATRRRS